MEPMSLVGVKVSTIVPSVAGGIAASLVMTGPLPWRITAGVVGAMCSIFFTDLALFAGLQLAGWIAPELPNSAPFVQALERAVAFSIGLTGLVICLTVIAAMERIRTRAPGIVDKSLDKLP